MVLQHSGECSTGLCELKSGLTKTKEARGDIKAIRRTVW